MLDAPYPSLITLGMDPYTSPGHLEFYCLFTFLLTAPDCHLSGMEFLIDLYAIVSRVAMWVSQVCVDSNLADLIQFNISAHGERRSISASSVGVGGVTQQVSGPCCITTASGRPFMLWTSPDFSS